MNTTRILTFLACITALPAAADLMKDSPVTFPDKGALPSKYPPDVTTKREVPEKSSRSAPATTAACRR